MSVTSEPRNDFWSRRRAAVHAESAAEESARLAAQRAEDEAAAAKALAEKTDDEILAELGLPQPEVLQQGDDFSGFMKSGVPDHLRRRALRCLWRSNPVLANLDGLLDHGEDFSDAATVFPDMKTTYQVGRGMLSHIVALADEAEREARFAAGEQIVDGPQPEVAISLDAAEQPIGAGSCQDEAVMAQDDADALETAQARLAEPKAPLRRAMRFSFASPMEGARI